MTPWRVDIIVPCFNMATYLRTAIESALGQTYPHLGVIVVNDGSTDNTASIAEGFGNRIRYIEIPHSGLSAARNAGILASGAEFLLFLDADDCLFPDAVDRHLKAATAHPANTIFHGGWQTIDDLGNKLSMDAPVQINIDAFHSLLAGDVPPSNCFFVRRRFVKDVGMFDTTLLSNEDWDMWLKLSAVGLNFVAVPDAIAIFRTRQGSMRSNLSVMLESYQKVLDRAILYHDDCDTCRKIYRYCNESWLRGHVSILRSKFNSLTEHGHVFRAWATLVASLAKAPQIVTFLLKRFYQKLR